MGLYRDNGKLNGNYCLGFRVPASGRKVAFIRAHSKGGQVCWIPWILQPIDGLKPKRPGNAHNAISGIVPVDAALVKEFSLNVDKGSLNKRTDNYPGSKFQSAFLCSCAEDCLATKQGRSE